jgi:hypothetical protein
MRTRRQQHRPDSCHLATVGLGQHPDRARAGGLASRKDSGNGSGNGEAAPFLQQPGGHAMRSAPNQPGLLFQAIRKTAALSAAAAGRRGIATPEAEVGLSRLRRAPAPLARKPHPRQRRGPQLALTDSPTRTLPAALSPSGHRRQHPIRRRVLEALLPPPLLLLSSHARDLLQRNALSSCVSVTQRLLLADRLAPARLLLHAGRAPWHTRTASSRHIAPAERSRP